MKFRFSELAHQTRAIAAAVDLFDGALLPPTSPAGSGFAAPGAHGHDGFRTDVDQLRNNMGTVQTREKVRIDGDLELLEETDLREVSRGFPNFSIEMETGTGKTYVYIRTCLQLAEDLGLRKFIIVVHSQAIRAGTLKTFDQLRGHFDDVFGVRYTVGTLSETSGLDDFTDPSDTARFLVAMVQSFDKPATNTLYRSEERLRLWSDGSGIDAIAACRPVLIIDEPQNMATPLRRRALATLNPLFALRYSATHKERFNLVHRLDAQTAQQEHLVKRVAVKGVAAGRDAGQAYIALLKTVARGRSVKATVRVNVPDGAGVKQRDLVVRAGDDLHDETGLAIYEGWEVEEIQRRPDRLLFTNGEVVEQYEQTETDRLAVWRDQLSATIRAHLRQEVEFAAGDVEVKVLSLFFVDAVADYVGHKAVLPELFDEVYAEVAEKYFPDESFPAPSERRTAYFAMTKKGSAKDTSGKSAEAEAEARAYRLIIETKEEILIRAAPEAFIFSHSALREGWDNPNVFQTCFLRQAVSPIQRRQQIGRGLRLARREDGTLLTGSEYELNQLTVVVDESFTEFRDALNREYGELSDGSRDENGGGDSGDGGPQVHDADSEVDVSLREDRLDSEEFTELWKRIRYRTRFRVELDSDELVTTVLESSEIKELRRVKVTANRITSAQLSYGRDGRVTTGALEAAETVGQRIERRGPLPDPVRLIEDRLAAGIPPLNLTRRTLARIVAGAPFQDRVVRQPEQWCAILADAIRAACVKHMLTGIKYEPLPEDDWWEADLIFDASLNAYDTPEPGGSAPWAGVVATTTDGPNLYTHVVHDSKVERQFGLQLDAHDEVVLFTKLPRRFRIDTPVGRYAPDFAIVVQDTQGAKRVYLIRETKATTNLGELASDEELRIRFAKSHFDVAPAGDVSFDWTTASAGLRLPDEE